MTNSREKGRVNALRFVLFEEEGAWVATCLEHYIGAQGSTKEDAQKGLMTVYRAELDYSLTRGETPFHGIMPAPPQFHDMWASGRDGVQKGTIYDKNGEPEALALAA